MKIFSCQKGVTLMEMVVTMGIMSGIVYGTMMTTSLMRKAQDNSETFASQQVTKNIIYKLVEQASLGINNIKYHPGQSLSVVYDADGNVNFNTISGWYYDPVSGKTAWSEADDGMSWTDVDGDTFNFRQNSFTIEKKNIGQSNAGSGTGSGSGSGAGASSSGYSKYYFSRCIDLQALNEAGATERDFVFESLIDINDSLYSAAAFYPVYEKIIEDRPNGGGGEGDEGEGEGESGASKRIYFRVKCCPIPGGTDALDLASCDNYIDKKENDRFRTRIFVGYRKDPTQDAFLRIIPAKGDLKRSTGAGFAVYFNHDTQPDVATVHAYMHTNKCQFDTGRTSFGAEVKDRSCNWGSKFTGTLYQRAIERAGIGNTGMMIIK